MNFYQALQLDPGGLKSAIRQAPGKKRRCFLWTAMLVRAVLTVAFSILVIAPIGPLFGIENNSVGVVLVCIILSIRFVDFGYCIRDSLLGMAVAFAILWAAPIAGDSMPPLLAAPVHLAALLIIFLITSQQPEYGNGGLYAFSYVFLTGNPVHGILAVKRGLLFVTGYLICAAIFYAKHRRKNKDIRLFDLVRSFRLDDSKSQWQLRLALGVSLLLLTGGLLHLERLMWAGFACASLLGCYSSAADARTKTRERFSQRIIGAITGSALFALIYLAVPQQYHSLFGPVGGIFLGFCTEYRHKTALNCLGALMLAAGLYGLQDSVILRIVNNLLGAAFGYGFFLLYEYVAARKFSGFSKKDTVSP